MPTRDNLRSINPSPVFSVENSSKRRLLVLGAIVLVVGATLSYALAAEALRSSNPVLGALSVALGLIGLASMHLALKNNKTFKTFGPTALLLDPPKPGIGGQLGASFSLQPKLQNNTFAPAAELTATLTCIQYSQTRSNGETSCASILVLWQETIPVFQTQTAKGIDAQLVIDLPENSLSGDDQNISWELLVEGDFGKPGQLSRTWNINIEETAVQKKSTLNIPAKLINSYETKAQNQADAESSKNIPINDDGVSVDLTSRGLPRGAEVVGCIFGVAFMTIGFFIMKDGDVSFGAIFAFFGMIGFGLALLGAGKKIEVNINKNTRVFNLSNTFFGITTSSYEAKVTGSDQFIIKNATGSEAAGGSAGYYNVCFDNDGEIINLRTWIEGERAAKALRNRIAEELFIDVELAAVA